MKACTTPLADLAAGSTSDPANASIAATTTRCPLCLAQCWTRERGSFTLTSARVSTNSWRSSRVRLTLLALNNPSALSPRTLTLTRCYRRLRLHLRSRRGHPRAHPQLVPRRPILRQSFPDRQRNLRPHAHLQASLGLPRRHPLPGAAETPFARDAQRLWRGQLELPLPRAARGSSAATRQCVVELPHVPIPSRVERD